MWSVKNKRMQKENPERGSTFQKLTGGIWGLVLMSTSAWAGDNFAKGGLDGSESGGDSAASVTGNPGDWCKAYDRFGKLYKNSDNPWIQEFTVFGRMHYQLGYVDGTSGGVRDFSYKTDEFRRFRLGAKAKLFNHFTVKGAANIYDDQGPRGGDEGFEFTNMWDLYATYDLKGAWGVDGFDALKFGYGARELHMGYEWLTSSKKIKTVERSAISNKIWPSDTEFSNPTGAWLEGANGKVGWTFGAFSTTQEDFIAGWDDGQLYYSKLSYDLKDVTGADKSTLYLTSFYQDADLGTDERLAGGVEWASALSFAYERGPWNLSIEGIYGDNGDQSNPAREGSFWGFVFTPSYWLVDDKLEAVFRYQYQGSENDQGIRLNSRYVRRAGAKQGDGVLSNGRGDEHHSAYLGLNYIICPDHHAKLMLGTEYDTISSGGNDVYDGWTTFLAFRTYF